MASLPSELVGITGRRYCSKDLLQERPYVGRVWTASSGPDTFVLKDIPINIWDSFNERILPHLHKNPCSLLRLPCDAIPDERIYVYKYLTDDFLRLDRKSIPQRASLGILRTTLRAIAELHDRDVVHLDIKPDNIMVDVRHIETDVVIEDVQLSDLENAAYLPEGRCIKGMLAGNDNWRSPEAHCKGELNKPADMFSFGLVCIYSMIGRVICGPDEDFAHHEAQGALPAMIRLQRQVSYFGDREGINGLMKHVGDEELNCQILSLLWDERNEDHIPYKSFSEWAGIHDEAFGDLVKGLMNLDPSRRISARQALLHPWFRPT